MSSTIHAATLNSNIPAYDASDKRAFAVGIALELIAARASSAAAVDLSQEIASLSAYADKIQAALKG